jgi:spore maturation protein CgeB
MLGSDVQRDISLLPAKKCGHTLRVETEEGTSKVLHSIYDPETEAKRIVDVLEFSGKGILVVLGLGLGYHIAELIRKFPDAELVVVEAVEAIYALAGEYGPDLQGKIEYITGCAPGEVIRKISRLQMKGGISPLAVFTLSSAVSAFPSYYNPIISSLNKITDVRLWDRIKYEKFKKERLHVLLIDSGYFLLKEVEKALQHLGHKVLRTPVVKESRGEQIISGFIEAIMDFKPDYIFTVNHLGLDEGGVLTSFFKSIEMPVASWFVDSPNLIVKDFDKNASPFVSLFIWDKSYMIDMESMGFESVEYLPLGTDENTFKRYNERKYRRKLAGYYCNVGFVGNSLVEKTDEKMKKVPDMLHSAIEEAAIALSAKVSSAPESNEKIEMAEVREYGSLSFQHRVDIEAAILWKATLLYRLSCIEKSKKFHIHIHGDKGWHELLDRSYTIKAPLNYYKELPFYYNACKLNLNATHFQMREAVNQRVFDIPACGSFLLTDHQTSLDDLFDVGKDIITYKHQDEIPEIVDYYLKNPDKRASVEIKGRKRVLREHTYKHRILNLIQFMKERYK